MLPFSATSLDLDESTLHCAYKLRGAFAELLKAHEYAQNLNACVWDFAVELKSLRHLKLTRTDLRWLIQAGLIDHGVEIPSSTGKSRTFDRTVTNSVGHASCFVLTSKGVAVSHTINGRTVDHPKMAVIGGEFRSPTMAHAKPTERAKPIWNEERNELLVGAIVIKRFRVPATSQQAVLAAFQEESWPPRIDDPLPPLSDLCPKRRLQDTIKSLNRNQYSQVIRFMGDGSAEGVLWEYCADVELTRL